MEACERDFMHVIETWNLGCNLKVARMFERKKVALGATRGSEFSHTHKENISREKRNRFPFLRFVRTSW